MHEYRLVDNKVNNKPPGCDLGNKKNSLRVSFDIHKPYLHFFFLWIDEGN